MCRFKKWFLYGSCVLYWREYGTYILSLKKRMHPSKKPFQVIRSIPIWNNYGTFVEERDDHRMRYSQPKKEITHYPQYEAKWGFFEITHHTFSCCNTFDWNLRCKGTKDYVLLYTLHSSGCETVSSQNLWKILLLTCLGCVKAQD